RGGDARRTAQGGPLVDHAHLADLEAMTVAAGPRQEYRPLAGASDVTRLEALAGIRSRRRDHLGCEAGDQHVTARAGRRALHRDIAEVVIVHHGSSPRPSKARAEARLLEGSEARRMPGGCRDLSVSYAARCAEAGRPAL